MKKSVLFFVLLVTMALITSCGGGGGTAANKGTGTATLQWSTPKYYIDDGTSMTVAGYKIYYGTESGVYSNVIDVGNINNYTVTGLYLGSTYFFVVTAYDANGVESDPTDEQAKTL